MQSRERQPIDDYLRLANQGDVRPGSKKYARQARAALGGLVEHCGTRI